MNALTDHRNLVDHLEEQMQGLPQVHCPLVHTFAGGVLCRSMTIPAGVVLTGAVHKLEHLCTVAQGHIWVHQESGVINLSAGDTFASKPGARRAGYAFETCVFNAYFLVGSERDLDKIMAEVVETERSALMGGALNVQGTNTRAYLDRVDFGRMLGHYGVQDTDIKCLTDGDDVNVGLPDDVQGIQIKESHIHGLGVFATQSFAAGGTIAPMRLRGFWTPVGRYMNHSCKANCVAGMIQRNGLVIHPIRPILAGEELTIDYRQLLSVAGYSFEPVEEIRSW